MLESALNFLVIAGGLYLAIGLLSAMIATVGGVFIAYKTYKLLKKRQEVRVPLALRKNSPL